MSFHSTDRNWCVCSFSIEELRTKDTERIPNVAHNSVTQLAISLVS